MISAGSAAASSASASASALELIDTYDHRSHWNGSRFAALLESFLLARVKGLVPFDSLKHSLHERERTRYAFGYGASPPINTGYRASTVTITTPDGASLKGDLFLPAPSMSEDGSGQFPCIVIRTPYGRKGMVSANAGPFFSERGIATLVQDTRGRGGSGDADFFPIKAERDDGETTVQWVRRQPWSNGKVGGYGVSYLGLTTYAMAGKGRVDAIMPVLAVSKMHPILFQDGQALNVDLVLRWLWLTLDVMKATPLRAVQKLLSKELHEALHDNTSALEEQDQLLLGAKLDYFQDMLRAEDVEHEFWDDKNDLCDLTDVERRPVIHCIAGWYDFFARQSFRDFVDATSVPGGRPVHLSVGPWHHWQMGQYQPTVLRLATQFFRAEFGLDKNAPELETGVSLFLINSKPGQWLHFGSWPPPASRIESLRLQSDADTWRGHLVFSGGFGHGRHEMGAPGQFTQHVYDPRNPTPAVGGRSFDFANTGRVRQNELEERDDVLTYTSPVLSYPLDVVGEIEAVIFLSSDNESTDLFLKLCEVDPQGNSFNVLEKLQRCAPRDFTYATTTASGERVAKIVVDLGPMAIRLRAGWRIRLQVSGGAHPLYMRNLGQPGVPFFAAKDFVPARRKIHHSERFPSEVHLPICLFASDKAGAARL